MTHGIDVVMLAACERKNGENDWVFMREVLTR